MNYLTFVDAPTYEVCFLVPQIKKADFVKNYIDPYGLDPKGVMALDLHYDRTKKKTAVAEMREYLTSEVIPYLVAGEVKYIAVTDAEYFKALTKASKVEENLGYLMDCVMDDRFKVIYVPNYKAKFYDPVKVGAKIDLAMRALCDVVWGKYRKPGEGIIHFAEYPTRPEDIEQWLIRLLEMNCPLTIDIEGFDLKHHKAGIGTISFAWSEHEGIAFPVDYVCEEWRTTVGKTEVQMYGKQVRNEPVRAMLKQFFRLFLQKAIYHNIAYDAYVLIYQLFMDDILDQKGLLEGLRTMLRNWDCTKLITYLATNSCAGNKLGLKDQAHEFAGNYAVGDEDIKDIRRIELPRLLEYNLVDSLSTWYVWKKHHKTMLADMQEDPYIKVFQPATIDIVQMQLTGMPVCMKTVVKVEAKLEKERADAMDRIQSSPLVQQFVYAKNEKWVVKRNSELVKKRVSMADAKEEFNPNSPDDMVELLFVQLALPVLSRTKTKAPSADGDSLKALVNHTTSQRVKDLLKALMDFKDVDKIIGTFIKALKGAVPGMDGWHYLFGNFNLGGTVSGRLSSSKPNLQNLPASSRYAKYIKSCFRAPPGWLFLGLDFASLEDRISALTTKDPNKLKVYTDGYDGHCLRAYAYFGDKMPDIDPTSVESINSIAKLYKPERQDSKAPTFALTYQGTYITLMTNCGFSEEKAKMVEEKYHELYVVSDKWVADKLDQASRDGYIVTAFGLRVRTPLLSQTVRGTSRTPHEAEAEGRTAGNALGQGWCLLNSRAWSAFMGPVRAHSEMCMAIKPCAQIHDAGYALVRDDIAAVLYMNEHLVREVNWNDHPDIYHPDVGLGGELSMFYPSWAEEMVIPNGATEEDIRSLLQEHMDKLEAA